MLIAQKIAALFAALTREEIAAMPPLQREKFAELLQHWASVAGKRHPQQQQQAREQSGVLASLRTGARAE
jgi:hypothetical protein